MPSLSAWTIRFSLIYLVAGFTIGALLLANKGVPLLPSAWMLLPTHVEFLIFGWVVQLAMGVGYWILPRYPGGGRGRIELAVCAVFLLNLGVLLVAAGSFPTLSSLQAAGRITEALAALLFTFHAWNRIRPMMKRN